MAQAVYLDIDSALLLDDLSSVGQEVHAVLFVSLFRDTRAIVRQTGQLGSEGSGLKTAIQMLTTAVTALNKVFLSSQPVERSKVWSTREEGLCWHATVCNIYSLMQLC